MRGNSSAFMGQRCQAYPDNGSPCSICTKKCYSPLIHMYRVFICITRHNTRHTYSHQSTVNTLCP